MPDKHGPLGTDADAEDRVMDDVRADEIMGIDPSEQSGLGGNSSVLEGYGEDLDQDDLPEDDAMMDIETAVPREGGQEDHVAMAEDAAVLSDDLAGLDDHDADLADLLGQLGRSRMAAEAAGLERDGTGLDHHGERGARADGEGGAGAEDDRGQDAQAEGGERHAHAPGDAAAGTAEHDAEQRKGPVRR